MSFAKDIYTGVVNELMYRSWARVILPSWDRVMANMTSLKWFAALLLPLNGDVQIRIKAANTRRVEISIDPVKF